VATRETDRDLRDPRDADLERAAAHAEVVEILAGAAVSLLLQQGPHPSPDDAPPPEKGSNTAIPRQVRGAA
jgi:hypothetical protein